MGVPHRRLACCPDSLTELSYQVVLIKGHPTWSGRAKHSYGHLLFLDLEEGVHDVQMLQITNPQIIPHGVRCEGLLRVLSWVSFDLPIHLKTTLSALLIAAGKGNTELHKVATEGRDIRDAQLESEAELQLALIAMIPVPGGPHDAGGLQCVTYWLSFCEAFLSKLLSFSLIWCSRSLTFYLPYIFVTQLTGHFYKTSILCCLVSFTVFFSPWSSGHLRKKPCETKMKTKWKKTRKKHCNRWKNVQVTGCVWIRIKPFNLY